MDYVKAIKEIIINSNYDEETKDKIIHYFDSMVEESNFLICLQNAGVDNWEGYEYAQELMEEDEDE